MRKKNILKTRKNQDFVESIVLMIGSQEKYRLLCTVCFEFSEENSPVKGNKRAQIFIKINLNNVITELGII